jgi:hypothetical protein
VLRKRVFAGAQSGCGVAVPPHLPDALAAETASRLMPAAAAANIDVTWLETPLDSEFSLIHQRKADAGLGASPTGRGQAARRAADVPPACRRAGRTACQRQDRPDRVPATGQAGVKSRGAGKERTTSRASVSTLLNIAGRARFMRDDHGTDHAVRAGPPQPR